MSAAAQKAGSPKAPRQPKAYLSASGFFFGFRLRFGVFGGGVRGGGAPVLMQMGKGLPVLLRMISPVAGCLNHIRKMMPSGISVHFLPVAIRTDPLSAAARVERCQVVHYPVERICQGCELLWLLPKGRSPDTARIKTLGRASTRPGATLPPFPGSYYTRSLTRRSDRTARRIFELFQALALRRRQVAS